MYKYVYINVYIHIYSVWIQNIQGANDYFQKGEQKFPKYLSEELLVT